MVFRVRALRDEFEKPRDIPHGLPPIGAGDYISALLIGQMKSGKTTALLNLLQEYARTKSYDNLHYISRTVAMDKKVLNVLNNLPHVNVSLYGEDDSLQDIVQEIKDENKAYETHLLYVKAYRRYRSLRREEDVSKLDDATILLLEQHNFQPPDDTLYPNGAPVHTIVLDDLLGSPLLSTRNTSALNKLISIHRHLRTNIFIALQAFSQSLSPALRSALNLYMLWDCKSDTIKKKMSEALAGHVSQDDFLSYWTRACIDPHDFFAVSLSSQYKWTRNLIENLE